MGLIDALDAQVDYWNREGPGKTFSHPIDWARFESAVSRDARILDYGCGYGRSMRELVDRGFRDVRGMDASDAMVAKTRALYPDLRVEPAPALAIPLPDGSVDAVLLLAVLTCIAGDAGQRALVAEIRRVLSPAGVVFVSDMELQPDDRNRERYARDAERFGTYGVFELAEGAVVRHHPEGWFADLFEGFSLGGRRQVEVRTMNGNAAVVTQFFASRKELKELPD